MKKVNESVLMDREKLEEMPDIRIPEVLAMYLKFKSFKK